MDSIHEKESNLISILKSYGNLAVAFSGGVDSTYLLDVAKDALGDKVVAISATASIFPKDERDEAAEFCKEKGIKRITVEADVFNLKEFTENPRERCYFCKKNLMGKMLAKAKEVDIKYIAEGSNVDDLKDFRPGMRALAELGIKSPLKEAGLTKEEIRTLSKERVLKTYDKPSFACLASRIPYGEEIDEKKIAMVGEAESFLKEKGFKQFRVRLHGQMARIEVMPGDIERFANAELRDAISDRFKEIGFTYTSLDLKGYRTGSLNEV